MYGIAHFGLDLQTDKLTLLATEMCCVHNSLIRGLNSIYHHAPLVQSAGWTSVRNLIGFSKSWYSFVKQHHDSEENFFFEKLDDELGAGSTKEQRQEHEAFHKGLERYYAYLCSLDGKEDSFSGSTLIQLIDDFSDPLMKHLSHELTSIMELSRFGNDGLIWKIWTDGVEAGKSEMQLWDLIEKAPLALMTHDVTYENGMHQNYPPIPAPLSFMIRYVFSLWYNGYWDFAPCNKSGQPKPSPAISA